ncbi:MAG: UvrD-helicase domain-containing protein [Deltaproteobacteria bacterium]|nr:UvrD-helicase domain-containing protein [Deltaproteobacteria bacterium]
MVTLSSLPSHLQDLNEKQLEAVTYGAGPLLIFAGAGSGKTRVLTRRLAHLIFTKAAHPMEILAVTFTNKAANEMKSRVSSLLMGNRYPLWVSTFHSICARLLRLHAEQLGYTNNYVIYDTSDSASLVKRILKQKKVEDSILAPKDILGHLDYLKNNYREIESLDNDTLKNRPYDVKLLIEVCLQYQEELMKANAMDFGDLICNVLNLFKLKPEILSHYQQHFKYVLVDEYQDTNRAQYLLIKSLSPVHRNICVVGDDDQSIYAFRGANVNNILNFRKDFPNAHVVKLEINYRSTKNIILAASSVISNNTKREKKNITTLNPKGNDLSIYTAFDENDEADFLIRQISSLKASGVPYQKIAVFYRTNAQSRAIEDALIKVNIPYEIFGGFKFYDRKEIKDIIAYLRLIINKKDDEALLRIINSPARGIGSTTVGQLQAFAKKDQLTLYQALTNICKAESKLFTGAIIKKLNIFYLLIEELSQAAQVVETQINSETENQYTKILYFMQFIESIGNKSGYLTKLKNKNEEDMSRQENIMELVRISQSYAHNALEQNEPILFSGFIERASLNSSADQSSKTLKINNEENEFISLMTLHLAKGLEFDYVFITGLEDGLLPHSHAFTATEEMEEERRLFYVGLTRAKLKLYLTYATSRSSYGRANCSSGYSSRFLEHIPANLIKDIR